MKLSIQREALLKALQSVVGAVERKQTLPILSNVLLDASDSGLNIIATDLEVELVSLVALDTVEEAGSVTVSARKFIDICRTLPEEGMLDITAEEGTLKIRAGRSRFVLSTLPAEDFPSLDTQADDMEFVLSQKDLRFLIENTHFAMAQQDVRYFLNGLLLEIRDGQLKVVATNGHRLAMSAQALSLDSSVNVQAIVPRKGIQELLRLLEDSDDPVMIGMGSNHLRVSGKDFLYVSKLIDGRFPDYQRVIPKNNEKVLTFDKAALKSVLSRVAVLAHEKFRGVRFQLKSNQLLITANNPEQEVAEEEIPVEYSGDDLDIAFNVHYFIDILNALPDGQVQLSLSTTDTSVLVESKDETYQQTLFVVMPMYL